MNKFKEVLVVLVGGAIGGWVSVIDAWTDPVSYPIASFAKVSALFLVPAIKGAVAGGLGVYLLTTQDTAQFARAFFFAVACGLTFPSVLAKGASMSQTVTSQVAAQNIDQAAAKINTAATQKSDGDKVDQIKAATVQILEAAPKVAEPDKSAVSVALEKAVSTLSETARSSGDKKAIEAISDIGTSPVALNFPLVKQRLVFELRGLRNEPNLKPESQALAAATVARLETGEATYKK